MFQFDFNRLQFNKAKKSKPSQQRSPIQGLYDVFTRLFDASKKDRTALNWNTQLSHIDHVIRDDLSILVSRSRHAFSNHNAIRKFIKMRVRHVVGSQGITLQVYGQTPDYNQATEKAFAQWSKQCDIAGRLNFRQMQAAVVRGMDMDGEVFIVLHEDSQAFQIQLIDGQRCPSALMLERQNGNRIVNGIEVNAYGKAVAYYFTKEDTPLNAYRNFGSEADYTRIEADRVLHLFIPQFIGQKRGIPSTATALTNLYHLEKYTFATLLNARSGANKGLVLKSDFLVDADPVDSLDEEGNKVEENKPDTLQMTTEGEIMILPDGYTPVTHNPSFPSGEYAAFKKEILKDVSSGLDVSYASLASDGEGTNFSTLRQFVLDERDEYTLGQQDLIDLFCEPIYERWLDYALLRGLIQSNGRAIPASQKEDLLNHHWQGRRWSWVDPLKDSSATINNLRSMTKSFSQTIREQGRDPQELYAEIARDLSEMQNAGIPTPIIEQFFGTSLNVNFQEQEGN